jgi:hypothetical protein
MTTTMLDFKKKGTAFFSWYFSSFFGWAISYGIIMAILIPQISSYFDAKAAQVVHSDYTMRKVNAYFPAGAELGKFIEGGLAFHEASLEEYCANEKKFSHHFVQAKLDENNSSVLLEYYAKNEGGTHGYKFSGKSMDLNLPTSWWWDFHPTGKIVNNGGVLCVVGEWQHGYTGRLLTLIAFLSALLAGALQLSFKYAMKKSYKKNFTT